MTHHSQETNLVDNYVIKILLTEDDDDSVVRIILQNMVMMIMRTMKGVKDKRSLSW